MNRASNGPEEPEGGSQEMKDEGSPQGQLSAQAPSPSSLEGLVEGERIARLSVFTLVGIGVAEVAVGQVTGSIGLTADGVDSLSDAVISVIVWFGLRLSQRSPDNRFRFGYYKVESLAAFAAALGMVGVGAVILYNSYLAFLNPREVSYPLVALVTLVGAGSLSLYRAFQMRRIANKYGLVSLRTDANNSIKDGSASFVVFLGVLLSSLGFRQMDAVGGMIVAGYVISVSYASIKTSSLLLLDACHRPELIERVRRIVELQTGVAVSDILLRPAGPFVHGEVHIRVQGSMTVADLSRLKKTINKAVREGTGVVQRLVVVAEPHPV